MRPTPIGDYRMVDVRAKRRHFRWACAAAFIAGLLLGAFGAHAVFADERTTVARALVDVGDYLCKQWGGLAEIGRAGPSRYAFRCRQLALFPDVEITTKKNP